MLFLRFYHSASGLICRLAHCIWLLSASRRAIGVPSRRTMMRRAQANTIGAADGVAGRFDFTGLHVGLVYSTASATPRVFHRARFIPRHAAAA